MFKRISLVSLVFFFLTASPVLAVKYGEGKYGAGNYSVTDMPTLPPGSNNNTAVSNEKCNNQTPGAKTPWLYGAVAENGNSIRLYFTAADNPVNKYVLEYGTKSGEYPYGVQNMGVNSRNQMTFLVKSLTASTTYFFKIRAGNGCATGNWSNEISAKTEGFISFNQLNIMDFDLKTVSKEKTSTSDKNSDENKEITEEIDENGYTVKIKVQDVDKKPILGAKIEIHSKVQKKTTNTSGIAVFKNVEKGEHKILIAYNNFKGEQTINLTGGVKEFDLNITVKEEKTMSSLQAKIAIGVLFFIVLLLLILLIKKKRQ